MDAPKESREFKAPQIDQTSLTGKHTSFAPHAMLYPHRACPNASFGFFTFLELPAVFTSLSSVAPQADTQKTSFNQVSTDLLYSHLLG